jgi:hypothetical protein
MKCNFPESLFHSLLNRFVGPLFSLTDVACHSHSLVLWSYEGLVSADFWERDDLTT